MALSRYHEASGQELANRWAAVAGSPYLPDRRALLTQADVDSVLALAQRATYAKAYIEVPQLLAITAGTDPDQISDHELALWYGFVLCSGNCSGNDENKDTTGDVHHQPECEYVLSPLSNTDGEYSPDEFLQFVGQVVLVAMLPEQTAQVGAKIDANVLNQCAAAVAGELQRTFGGASPRCTTRSVIRTKRSNCSWLAAWRKSGSGVP